MIGVGIGYFLGKNSKINRETTLIVRINYNSVPLIYNAVGQLNEQLRDNNIDLLKKYNLYEDGHKLLKEIDIEPIVNINDIVEKISDSDHYMEALLDHSKIAGDEFFTSELFIPLYHDHKINISMDNDADIGIVRHILNYLNDIEALQNAKEVYRDNLKFKIHEDRFSIAQIDSILQKTGTQKISLPSRNQPFIQNDQRNVYNLNMILQEKKKILNRLEAMQAKLLIYNEPVILKNDPLPSNNKVSNYNKIVYIPIILVVLYILLALFWSLFRKAKYLSENRAS